MIFLGKWVWDFRFCYLLLYFYFLILWFFFYNNKLCEWKSKKKMFFSVKKSDMVRR